MANTSQQFDKVARRCHQLFSHKLQDYGAAWRIMRLPSLTDQIFIKAQRLRTLEQAGKQMIADKPEDEYIGIFNYAAIALVQLRKGIAEQPDIKATQALELYEKEVGEAKALMLKKNHDYGEAWRDMRMESLTDLILQKLLRIKQIEQNKGKTVASEGLAANYADMLNYAAFALIKIDEKQTLKEKEKTS